MKKCVLILGMILGFNANADDEITIIAQTNPNDASTKCGDNCTWTLYSNGKLEISGSGDMYEWYDQGWNTPWKGYAENITNVVIEGATKDENGNVLNKGITSIGSVAFANLNSMKSIEVPDSVKFISSLAFYAATALESIHIPQSVESMNWGTFELTSSLKDIVLPDSLTYIPDYCFLDNTSLEALIIPESITQVNDHAFDNTSATIYCTSASLCVDKGADESQIQTYTKDKITGIYESDGLYFLSSDDMIRAGKTTDATEKYEISCGDLDSCKAQGLKNKGLCSDLTGDCKTIVDSDNAARMIIVGSKTYQSLEALLKGKYDVRRIYTVDEANAVAGEKNRVSIKYR